ncbi:hypothetical protein [Aureispira sp. CCB-E]|uniref:hypothetical protein n=1 Tax=Aureispira sp. CCB-E TaxID=3051121 RepID=UPI002869044C|nr:hypothetical protein [Aureispira sp. CCB-E]WMX13198.1 hypothetical protein QP953_20350 [Aureispira sp. CCB-E]
MLKKIGFKIDRVRKNYLKALINLEYTESWTMGFPNDYSRNFQVLMLGRAIKRLYKEIELKATTSSFLTINYNMISASEVGNFVFCPVSYSIQKSLLVDEDPESNVELIWDEKKILLDRINAYKKAKNINHAFSSEEMNKIGTLPKSIGYILSSKILQENKKNKKSIIFYNKANDFCGVPDYWLSNNENFVVEEKFTRYNENKVSSENEYLNHKAELLAQMIELDKLGAKNGYIIYWLWNFEKVRYENRVSTDYRLRNVKIHEVKLTPENRKYYNQVILNIRDFNTKKAINFNVNSLKPNKCINCGVSQYCHHKTGLIPQIQLPYNKK